jgi:hypothetical protein
MHLSQIKARLGATMAALSFPLLAHAGRPLAVEDAGVNPVAQCQVESWLERGTATGSVTHFVLAPACGVFQGVELGLEGGWAQQSSRGDTHRALALKWVPEAAQWGPWQFGAKLTVGSQRPAGENQWGDAPTGVLAIGTWQTSEQWTVHVNLGADTPHDNGETVGHAGVAAVWTPHPSVLMFAELTGAQRESATRGAGLRYWLIPDTLGLDVTVSRTNAVRDSTSLTLGVGWYGIRF